MPVYVLREGRMVDRATGLPMLNQADLARPLQCPAGIPDIEPYRSPCDGRYVSGRREKRDDLAHNGCIDAADMPTLGGKLKNKRFAEKWGLKGRLKEELRD